MKQVNETDVKMHLARRFLIHLHIYYSGSLMFGGWETPLNIS